MNYRGIVAEWTDFILIVVGALIFFFLIGFFFAGSSADRDEQTIRNAERAVKAENALIENRIQLEKGLTINIVELRRQLDDLQERGFVSSPELQEEPGGLAET